MKKLFVFAIGGSGSRVLKSLAMLLSSGVKLNGFELIPIIVDPHQSNLDLKRTLKILDYYQRVREQLSNPEKGFFSTPLRTLNELAPEDVLSNTFSFNLDGVSNQQFKNYIDYQTLDPANKALTSVLFSRSNLNTEMDIGFVGNPNMGSVVLNQFSESNEFKYFASNFQEGDRVFIISSIFGGTGAAGFPIVLKNIRNAAPPLPNSQLVKEAAVGALTLMPYFGVAPKDDGDQIEINKGTFMSKTRAALHYYQSNVTGNDSLNALYYLGDRVSKDYEHDPGAGGQQNDAHFVEMAAALSIVDYCALGDSELTTRDGRAEDPKYFEFGVKEEKEMITFDQLGDQTQRMIKRPLTQYFFFIRFLKKQMDGSIKSGAPFTAKRDPKLDVAFMGSPFVKSHLSLINKAFDDWLREMGNNKRSFMPFNLDYSNLSTAIRDVKTRSSWMGGHKKLGFKDFEGALNSYEAAHGTYPNAAEKLLDVFHGGTNKLIDDYFANF